MFQMSFLALLTSSNSIASFSIKFIISSQTSFDMWLYILFYFLFCCFLFAWCLLYRNTLSLWHFPIFFVCFYHLFSLFLQQVYGCKWSRWNKCLNFIDQIFCANITLRPYKHAVFAFTCFKNIKTCDFCHNTNHIEY